MYQNNFSIKKFYIPTIYIFDMMSRPLNPAFRESSRADSILFHKSQITYCKLRMILEKAYRNGNWNRLTHLERTLYRAGLELASLRKRIVNKSLLSLLYGIIKKLLTKFSNRIWKLGRSKAEELKTNYQKQGMFSLCPFLRNLLEDASYLFWLGNREVLLKNLRML